MDLVSEVIISSDEVQLNALTEKIQYLFSEIDNVKHQISKDFERKYVDMNPLQENTIGVDILKLKTSLENADNDLKGQMKASVIKLHNDLRDMSDEVINFLDQSRLLEICINIDNLLNYVSGPNADNSVLETSYKVKEAGRLLQMLTDCKEFIEILDGMYQKQLYLQTTLVVNATEKWNDLVSWEEISMGKKGKSVKLKLSKCFSRIDEVYKILTMFQPELTPQAYDFANMMMKEFFRPLITCQSVLSSQDTIDCNILSIEYKLKTSKSVGNNFFSATDDILTLMLFLKNNLSIVSHEGSNFLSTMGSVLSSEMISLLINEQIINLVPLKKDLYDQFVPVAEKIRTFNNNLLELGFIDKSSEELEEFYGDIEVMLRNKMSSLYLNRAKECMKKDLHDTISVGPLNAYCCKESSRFDGSTFIPDPEDNTKWIFPKCQVSRWMCDLVYLIKDCLDEAVKSDYSYALTLINTSRSIFTLFTTAVPRLHRKLLDTIPQQSAILYNNAMYLSYNVLILEKSLRSQYSGDIASHQISLGDQVHQLISMGTEELNHQRLLQNNLLVSTLDSSGLTQLSDMEIFNKSIENGIRQGMRQLMVLNNVWSNTLPDQVYSTAIGHLCDNFIKHLIHLILTAKDIREDIANQLVIMIDIIFEKAPQLFKEPKEIHRHVSSWMKMGELKRVLAGTLADILDRWAGGNGPLALEFQPAQVHHLIKALFRSSDHREQTIALI